LSDSLPALIHYLIRHSMSHTPFRNSPSKQLYLRLWNSYEDSKFRFRIPLRNQSRYKLNEPNRRRSPDPLLVPWIVRVYHGLPLGWLFPHHTRTRVHHNLQWVTPSQPLNHAVSLRNPQYLTYLWYITYKICYLLLHTILM
jgi:hypothetical protein